MSIDEHAGWSQPHGYLHRHYWQNNETLCGFVVRTPWLEGLSTDDEPPVNVINCPICAKRRDAPVHNQANLRPEATS